MRSDLYDSLADTEETHWWFQARKSIILALLDRELAGMSPKLAILDVGAGTGMLAEALTRFGRVTALETAPEALLHLERRKDITIVQGILPNPDLPRGAYDLVTGFDVLEHIEDDRSAMADIADVLRPGGFLLLTVPAHPRLWSDHDEIHHHFRRYRPGEVESLARASGLHVRFSSPFQTLLFPLFLAERLVRRLRPSEAHTEVPPRPVNWIARRVFSFERHWIARRVRAPIGSSHIVLAMKPDKPIREDGP
ncbi:MAG: class I SAM-dependent methyltransferase [Longimicrobiales bacterium]